jgi:AraC-like DNA-binding protein
MCLHPFPGRRRFRVCLRFRSFHSCPGHGASLSGNRPFCHHRPGGRAYAPPAFDAPGDSGTGPPLCIPHELFSLETHALRRRELRRPPSSTRPVWSLRHRPRCSRTMADSPSGTRIPGRRRRQIPGRDGPLEACRVLSRFARPRIRVLSRLPAGRTVDRGADGPEILDRRSDGRLLEVLARIQAGLSGPLRSRDLARDACLSEDRFLHLFKEQLGITLRHYIIHQRLLRATADILSGTSVTRAALDAGFADSAHFSRRFLALAGFPPSHLKQARGAVRIYSCHSSRCVRPASHTPGDDACTECVLFRERQRSGRSTPGSP